MKELQNLKLKPTLDKKEKKTTIERTCYYKCITNKIFGTKDRYVFYYKSKNIIPKNLRNKVKERTGNYMILQYKDGQGILSLKAMTKKELIKLHNILNMPYKHFTYIQTSEKVFKDNGEITVKEPKPVIISYGFHRDTSIASRPHYNFLKSLGYQLNQGRLCGKEKNPISEVKIKYVQKELEE